MSRKITTITITVEIGGTEYVRQVQGTHWARDDSRNVFVYDEDGPILEVTEDHFVEAFYEDNVETIATIN